jgi:hypothetical protein
MSSSDQLPVVSIVVPMRNSTPTVGAAGRSVLNRS